MSLPMSSVCPAKPFTYACSIQEAGPLHLKYSARGSASGLHLGGVPDGLQPACVILLQPVEHEGHQPLEIHRSRRIVRSHDHGSQAAMRSNDLTSTTACISGSTISGDLQSA